MPIRREVALSIDGLLRYRKALAQLRMLLVAVVYLTCPAQVAADFEAGTVAFGEGDYATAYKEWLPLARDGDSAAQFSLGVLFSEGLGVEADYAKAVNWYQLAAQQGVVAAQFTLGVLYAQGVGVTADLSESAKWYGQAARQGDADAQFALGLIFSQGAGVRHDQKRAALWFKRAAIQGHGIAQASLGLLYQLGQGVPQDDVCAYGWFNLAATAGSKRAQLKRDELRGQMTAAQVARAQGLGRMLARTGACEIAAPATLITQVAKRLRALGYDPGPLGKRTDALTSEAVMAFQTDIGLSPTGRISEELLLLLKAHKTEKP